MINVAYGRSALKGEPETEFSRASARRKPEVLKQELRRHYVSFAKLCDCSVNYVLATTGAERWETQLKILPGGRLSRLTPHPLHRKPKKPSRLWPLTHSVVLLFTIPLVHPKFLVSFRKFLVSPSEILSTSDREEWFYLLIRFFWINQLKTFGSPNRLI